MMTAGQGQLWHRAMLGGVEDYEAVIPPRANRALADAKKDK